MALSDPSDALVQAVWLGSDSVHYINFNWVL